MKFEFHWKSGPAPKRTESLETADSAIIATIRSKPMIAINVSIVEPHIVHDCKGNIHYPEIRMEIAWQQLKFESAENL